MEHRKRNMMQHKLEMPVMIKIVTAAKSKKTKNISRQLAEEAVKNVLETDKAVSKLVLN